MTAPGPIYVGGPLRISQLEGGGASIEISMPASPLAWGQPGYEPILALWPDPALPGGIAEELPGSGRILLHSLRSGRLSVRDLSAAYGRAAGMIAAPQDESNEKQKERQEP